MDFLSVVVLAALCLLTAAPVLAGDGVFEINQTCAVQAGCFPGDTAGLPVLISAPGSYRLTSNLVVPNVNTSGIRVGSDNVSIDLDGFEIRGPVSCSGLPVTCSSSSGTGSGVERTVSTLSGTSVRNGSIRGMGAHGILLGDHAELTNLRVSSNRVRGIQVEDDAVLSRNLIFQNGSDGILADVGATVSGSSIHHNGGDGIFANGLCTISGNTIYQSFRDGVHISFGATGRCNISGNTISLNGEDQIEAFDCRVVGNGISGDRLPLLNISKCGYGGNVMVTSIPGVAIACTGACVKLSPDMTALLP